MPTTYNILNISRLIGDITKEMSVLVGKLIKGKNNINVYGEFLEDNLAYVKWLNKKYDLRTSKTPQYVYKRDIFYAELGINLGSEQGYKRPVVVLQNDAANKHCETVIIAPITTYNSSDIVTDANGDLCVKIAKNGTTTLKKMGFYNILVKLESGYSQQIVGFINIGHMREISKKRMAERPVAKITEDNFKEIQEAIIKNLDFTIDNKA